MAKKRINISLEASVLAVIDELASEHTGGDRSAWIAQAAVCVPRRQLTKKQRAQLTKLQAALALFSGGAQ